MSENNNNFANELTGKYISFYLKDILYCIELSDVLEIINIQHITYLPAMPNYVNGIINLRGKILPVIDMNLRFNQDKTEYTDKTCIVVIAINDVHIGLIVDSVYEVVTSDSTEYTEIPSFDNINHKRYLNNIIKYNNLSILNINCKEVLDIIIEKNV